MTAHKTFEQVAAAGFGIATASGAWRAVHRALAQIPKQEADQAREAQLVRLQAVRMLLWNQASADPIRAAEALIKLEAREARLLGLDMPTKELLRLIHDRQIRYVMVEGIAHVPEDAVEEFRTRADA